MTETQVDELLRLLERERDARAMIERSATSTADELRTTRQSLERLTSGLEAMVDARTQDVVRARDAALRASRDQASALAAMSHEVRTPMHTILGLSEHLLGQELTKEQKASVQRIVDNATRLASMIDDFLDLTRLDSGRSTLEVDVFDLREVIESAIDVVALQAHRKGIELVCDVDPAMASSVVGDSRKLGQVLVNLLSNAVKYTQVGQVMLVASGSRASGAVTLDLSVHDTGMGISAEDQKRIFQPFVRVGPSGDERGTGLGLALVKNIVEQMEGTIRVVSEPGRGSVFHLRVPFAAVDEEAHVPRYGGKTILIVEPVERRRAALARILHYEGARVQEAPHWSVARSRCSPRDVDVVLVTTAAEELGVLGEDCHGAIWDSVPLVLLTAASQSEAITLRLLGASAAVEKPVRRKRLFDALDLALGRRSGEALVSDGAPTPRRSDVRPRALLVEDDPDNRHLLARWLGELGYATESVADGRMALARVNDAVYDVIVTDLAMPHMSGVELVFALRSLEAKRDLVRTPIVVITASAFESTRAECIRAGADAFHVKPVRKSLLATTLTELVDARPTLLVADDSPDAVDLVRAFLGPKPTHRLVVANDGPSAVARVKTQRIDFVLMDLEMAGSDGMDAARAMREHLRTRALPIVAATGHGDPETRRRCLEAGFDDVMTKPFSREALQRTLRRVDFGTKPHDATGAAAPTPAFAPTDVVVDADIADLVPKFLENRRRDVERMRQWSAAGDFASVRRVAHAVKGTGGGFGFHEVTRLGAQLEAAALDASTREVEQTLAALDEHLRTVRYHVRG